VNDDLPLPSLGAESKLSNALYFQILFSFHFIFPFRRFLKRLVKAFDKVISQSAAYVQLQLAMN
jgi:hypothetical protein